MAHELRFPTINSVIISGRLTRDIDLRYTPNGVPVANLSIAFSRRYQLQGEWQEETSYIDVIVWNKRAEQCGQELQKGSPVLVEGYLRTRNYTTKDNQNRKIVEIVANKISFLEKKEQVQNKDTAFDEVVYNDNTITEDDVPF